MNIIITEHKLQKKTFNQCFEEKISFVVEQCVYNMTKQFWMYLIFLRHITHLTGNAKHHLLQKEKHVTRDPQAVQQ